MSRFGLIRDLHPAGAGAFWFAATLTVILVLTGWAFGAAIAVLCAVLAFCHYRLPGAAGRHDETAIASPMDGKILLAGRATPPGDTDTRFRLRLKGRVSDSRMIVSPVTGTVRQAALRDGITVETEDGQRVRIAMKAGWFGLKGRVLTFSGQTVTRGDALAIAAPGGFTDVFLPAGMRGIRAGGRVLTGQHLT